MGKLSVIIPLYRGHDTLKQALRSIAIQSIIDEVEIVIVNDCDGIDYSDILSRFSDLDIKYITNDYNRGCGGSRNSGIKEATNEYICFLDSDDMFLSPLALELMYHRAIVTKADVVVGEFQSEMRSDKGVAIKKMKCSPTWMHGKLFRKSYLINNNIWFRECLRLNEDVEMFQIVVDLGAKIVELDYECVLWRDNPKSLTHESLYKNKRTFIDACAEYIKDCAERKLSGERVTIRVLQNLVIIYQYVNIVMDENDDKVSDFMLACKDYWKIIEPIVSDVNDELITKVYCQIAKTFEFVPSIGFIEFLNEIKA